PGRRALWRVVIGVLLAVFGASALGGGVGAAFNVTVLVGMGFFIKCWLGFVVPLSLNDARRNGALELLLCTPLSPQVIVRGQFEAITSYFYGPALVFVFGSMGVACLGSMVSGDRHATEFAAMFVLVGMFWFLLFLLDLYAVGYTALWFSLTERRPGHATSKTLLYVIVLPWLLMIIPPLGLLAWFLWP